MVAFLLFASSSAQARLGQSGGSADSVISSMDQDPGHSTPNESRVAWLSRLSILAGVSIYNYADQAFAAPALAARMAVSDRWSVEVGGSFNTLAGSLFRHVERPINGLWMAHLDSASEIHLAGVYDLPHGTQPWAVPELALGLSQLTEHNIVQHFPFNGNANSYDSPTTHAWSPTLGLAVRLFTQSTVTLNLGLSYASYSNTIEEPGQTFNLGLNGLSYRVMVDVRL